MGRLGGVPGTALLPTLGCDFTAFDHCPPCNYLIQRHYEEEESGLRKDLCISELLGLILSKNRLKSTSQTKGRLCSKQSRCIVLSLPHCRLTLRSAVQSRAIARLHSCKLGAELGAEEMLLASCLVLFLFSRTHLDSLAQGLIEWLLVKRPLPEKYTLATHSSQNCICCN